ncbi:MAG: hypothetical protein PHS39_02010 [Atribacterota bacterium]|nr:hypothetical protein [Atribacterota bacterium]
MVLNNLSPDRRDIHLLIKMNMNKIKSTKTRYNADWCNSIDEISKDDWGQIFGYSILEGYSFFYAMEKAELSGASFFYLRIRDGQKILALVPCFTYNLQLDVLAPVFIKKNAKKIRSIFSGFLQVKILGVGSLASTCRQHIGILKGLTMEESDVIGKIISQEIKIKAKSLRHKLVFIKEVPSGQLNNIKAILSEDFYFYHSLPNSFIPILEETTPYPSGLKRKERERYKSLKKKFAEKYRWELVSDFSSLTTEFEKKYIDTYNRSKNKFEVLNKRFFDFINSELNQDSFLLIAKSLDGENQSIGLVLNEEDSLIPLYLGLNYDEKDSKTIKLLHLNSMLRVIEEAEERGKSQVILGQTSYYPKVLSGALVEGLYLGFYSYNNFIQFFIRHFLGKLFTPTKVLDNVYKKEIGVRLKGWYSEQGIDICN